MKSELNICKIKISIKINVLKSNSINLLIYLTKFKI